MFCVFLPNKREKFVVEDKTIHFGDVLRWSMCAQWSSRHHGGAVGCKKGEKKESREKYSLCAGGVDWRVVGDEEGGRGEGWKKASKHRDPALFCFGGHQVSSKCAWCVPSSALVI